MYFDSIHKHEYPLNIKVHMFVSEGKDTTAPSTPRFNILPTRKKYLKSVLNLNI